MERDIKRAHTHQDLYIARTSELSALQAGRVHPSLRTGSSEVDISSGLNWALHVGAAASAVDLRLHSNANILRMTYFLRNIESNSFSLQCFSTGALSPGIKMLLEFSLVQWPFLIMHFAIFFWKKQISRSYFAKRTSAFFARFEMK